MARWLLLDTGEIQNLENSWENICPFINFISKAMVLILVNELNTCTLSRENRTKQNNTSDQYESNLSDCFFPKIAQIPHFGSLTLIFQEEFLDRKLWQKMACIAKHVSGVKAYFYQIFFAKNMKNYKEFTKTFSSSWIPFALVVVLC